MARTDFPYQTFQDLEGNPLAGGSITIRISQDAQATSGQVCQGSLLTVLLDSSGTVTHIPQVWPNAELVPTGTSYTLEAYAANGQRVLGPKKVTV